MNNAIKNSLNAVLEEYNPLFRSLEEIPNQMRKEAEELISVGLINCNNEEIEIRKWELEGLIAGWKALKHTFSK